MAGRPTTSHHRTRRWSLDSEHNPRRPSVSDLRCTRWLVPTAHPTSERTPGTRAIPIRATSATGCTKGCSTSPMMRTPSAQLHDGAAAARRQSVAFRLAKAADSGQSQQPPAPTRCCHVQRLLARPLPECLVRLRRPATHSKQSTKSASVANRLCGGGACAVCRAVGARAVAKVCGAASTLTSGCHGILPTFDKTSRAKHVGNTLRRWGIGWRDGARGTLEAVAGHRIARTRWMVRCGTWDSYREAAHAA